jgi:hypothetical protein
MMPNQAPAPGDELAALARRYRHEAVATLIAVQRDPRAPASARAQAATKLLEYADGRPSQARQITVADLPSMTDDQRKELLAALLFQYETEMPGAFKAMLEEATREMLEEQLRREAAAPPPRLTHQPHTPVETRKITRPGQSEPSPPPPPERAEPALLPDNVVTLPPPLPRGTHPSIPSTISPQGAAHGSDNAVPPGGVHPHTLYLSTLPPSLALDSAYRGYPWRSR